MKRVLLLNPPARRKVIRDYYCSKSTKSNYLFQPIDLVMQSGVLAPHCELHAIDAVAQRLSSADCMSEIERIKPELVLGLWGAVSDSEDREFYRRLAERMEAPIFISGEVALDNPAQWLREHDYIQGALLRFVSTGLLEYLATGAPGPDLAVNEGGQIRGGLDPAPAREFSLTYEQAKERWPNMTPMSRALATRCRAGSRPRTRQLPAVGWMMPVSILMVVDLPAPLGPM